MGPATATPAADGRADGPALAERFARREPAAFDCVVRLYGPRVAALARCLLGFADAGSVEDVVQDVFLAAWERAGRFRGDSSLWTWLTAITLNRCRARWRRRRVSELAMRLLARRPTRSAAAADGRAIGDETGRQVREAVAGLPHGLREVVVLYYFEQMPVEQIGQILGASRGAIEVRLHRARAALREALGDEFEDQRS